MGEARREAVLHRGEGARLRNGPHRLEHARERHMPNGEVLHPLGAAGTASAHHQLLDDKDSPHARPVSRRSGRARRTERTAARQRVRGEADDGADPQEKRRSPPRINVAPRGERLVVAADTPESAAPATTNADDSELRRETLEFAGQRARPRRQGRHHDCGTRRPRRTRVPKSTSVGPLWPHLGQTLAGGSSSR